MKNKINKTILSEADLYQKYCSAYNASGAVFQLVIRSIEDNIMHVIDIQQLEQECEYYFQAVRLTKRMINYPMITFDEDKKKFKVEKHYFTTLDEAIKATEMKALL